MATLRVPRAQVEKMLDECIRTGQELTENARLAERTGGYRDWLDLFGHWRLKSLTALKAAYEGQEDANGFDFMTAVTERSASQRTFEDTKAKLNFGLLMLGQLVERLPLTLPQSQEIVGMKTLHPEIFSRCHRLFETGDYAEAVEKGFKVVRDRLRSLTTYETGSEAFGRGKLYVEGAAAPHVDDDFQEGVKFLTMAIDRFRNEKAHTADGNISEPIRAYEYLCLSSLAMHLLEKAVVR
jgi:uncharacterized protein (TIGR02391 family)